MDRIVSKETKLKTRIENQIDTIKMEWINGREYERRTYGTGARMRHAKMSAWRRHLRAHFSQDKTNLG